MGMGYLSHLSHMGKKTMYFGCKSKIMLEALAREVMGAREQSYG